MKKNIVCMLLTALLTLTAGCGAAGAGSGDPNDNGQNANITGAEVTAVISLSGDSAQADGSGVTIDGSQVTINSAGSYRVSGALDDGQIFIKAGKDDEVELILDNADISCSYSAAIYAEKAGLTVITLNAGTINRLTDGSSYTYAEGEDEPDAALFAKNDLTIRGPGSLTVEGNFNNSIGTKDNLLIEGGIITVTSVKDALRGRDSVTVNGGTFDLTSGGDGIKSNNDTDAEKGWISIDGGNFDIKTDNDGLQAETSLTVSGGTFNIVSGGGYESQQPADISMKGLKAGTDISVNGGIFNIDSADDALHSNGTVTVEGGQFTITTGDDGMHGDSATVIKGGDIDIIACYEGIEGSTVDIGGGSISITASDDAINAAGGSDQGEAFGRFGKDNFSSDDSKYIRITGGYISIDASGDGIDSNGNLYFDGGIVIVNGPTSGGDGALDYDGICEITGGTLITAGSSAMAQSPGSTSTQSVLTVYFSSTQAAGTVFSLSDSKGNSVVTFAPAKEYQCITISTGDMKEGETYTLSIGGTATGESVDGLYTGEYTKGTEVLRATLDSVITSLRDDGSEASGMGGGMMPPRREGMDGRGRFN